MPEAVNTQDTNVEPEEKVDGIQKELNAADPNSDNADGTPSDQNKEATKEDAPDAGTDDKSSSTAANEKTKNTWVQKRIDALTAEKHQERREKEAFRAKTETLLAELAEMRKGTAPAAAQNQTEQANSAQQDNKAMSEAEIEARAMAKADEIARMRAFNKACNDTYNSGKEEFDDFDRTINTFNMFSEGKGVPASILDIITEMPKGHAVLYNLGKDPDLIEKVVRMPPAKQALELARIEASISKPSTRSVSNAPAPVKPIDGAGRSEADPERMSMEDYVKWREKTARKR